jgi:V-type H+-transporting ATPase subunit a
MAESTFFRSEEMSLIQLYIPAEVAQPTVSELGELGLVQFRDVRQPAVTLYQHMVKGVLM